MNPILLIEDDADDAFLVKTACERTGLPHSLQVVQDGLEAVAYLSGDGPYCDREKYPLPSLVFLDIKMPKMDGHEVLAWIRAQPQFATLPVVMLTTSYLTSDMERAYAIGVNSFLRKKDSLRGLEQSMDTVMKYWLMLNLGPRPDGPIKHPEK